jgi:hypothetical protein
MTMRRTLFDGFGLGEHLIPFSGFPCQEGATHPTLEKGSSRKASDKLQRKCREYPVGTM